MVPAGWGNGATAAQQPPWARGASGPTHHVRGGEEQRRAGMGSGGGGGGGGGGRQNRQQQQQPRMGLPPPRPAPPPPPPRQEPQGPPQGESSAMKSLLKYSNQQQPLLLSQKSPFGGLGSLKSGLAGGSCALQGSKQALPPRKAPGNDGERSDCGGRGREMGEAGHGEGEVRQPPVGIAVAVARQREPPCRPADSHPSSRQGRVHPSMKGEGEGGSGWRGVGGLEGGEGGGGVWSSPGGALPL